MNKRIKALVMATALVVQLAVGVVVGAGSASASTGPADDRQMTAPVGWWTYTGATVTTLSSLLNTNHARLTDLKVDDPSIPTFTAVMVSNSGPYASGWWWYVGETQAQVSSLLSTNNARLISAQAYNTSNGVRYAVVMVSNTGANAKAWWWYVGTTTQLSTDLTNNHARMIQVTPYPGSTTTYVAIMVDNTGTNASGWWWYVHESVSTISSQLSTNKARLVDLSRNDDGTYNVVMYSDTTTRWYWYVAQSPSAAVARAGQQGERIITATSYVISGTKYYSVVETQNTNATAEKLYDIIAPTIDSGAFGFYLKQVGHPETAGLEENTQYEPASALKVLYHAYSIHQESLGNSHDGDSITYHYDPAHPNNQGICPDNFPSTVDDQPEERRPADDVELRQPDDPRHPREVHEGLDPELRNVSGTHLDRDQPQHRLPDAGDTQPHDTDRPRQGLRGIPERHDHLEREVEGRVQVADAQRCELQRLPVIDLPGRAVRREQSRQEQRDGHQVLQRDEVAGQGRQLPVRRLAALHGVVGRPVADRRAVQEHVRQDPPSILHLR